MSECYVCSAILACYIDHLWTTIGFCCIVKVCDTIWTYFGICSSCRNTFPWVCNHCWSCHHWAPLDNFVVMDGCESLRDSRGTLRLPFPMESLKFLTFIWRVSLKFPHLCLISASWFILLLYLLLNFVSSIFQIWFPRLSSSFVVHQVRKLFINIHLHGLVSIQHIFL